MTRRRERAVLPALLLVLLLPSACGRPRTEAPPVVAGRVLAPEGMSMDGVCVLARGVRSGRERLGYASYDGTFTVHLRDLEDEIVDVQVTFVPTLDLDLPHDRIPTTEEVDAALRLHPDQVNRDPFHHLGDLEGYVRSVAVGREDVMVPLWRRVLKPLELEVREPDGTPAAGVRVSLQSMADGLSGVTDASGRVRWDEVPVREWRARMRRATEAAGLERTVVPHGEPIGITLRMPWSITLRSDGAVPEGAFLMVARAGEGRFLGPMPWAPDDAGRHVLEVDPGVAALYVVLNVWESENSYRPIASLTLTCRPDAEGVLSVRPDAAR